MWVSCELRVAVFECRLDLREGTLEREGHGLLHLTRDPRRQPVRLGGRECAVLYEDAAEARHRIATKCRLVLFTLAEHGNGLVLRVMQRHTRRRDDVPVC